MARISLKNALRRLSIYIICVAFATAVAAQTQKTEERKVERGETLYKISREYGVEIVQLGFDRYNAISTVQKLESAEEPMECVEIKQHSSVLHRPTISTHTPAKA